MLEFNREHELNVALVYDDDAYLEHGGQSATPAGHKQGGLFGRHVANSEFLNAWLSFGDWQQMVGVVANQASGQSLAQRFSALSNRNSQQRRLEIVAIANFQQRFFPTSPASVLHLPQPIDTEFAWVRQHKGAHAFALSGVTHTLSLKGVMDRIRELVTGPFESYDTLFCISDAAVNVVRSVADNYAEFLRQRHGGAPRLRTRLARVPFGIDTERLRPATPDQRAAIRRELGIGTDEVCVLFVGRLSYHSKVHPFPMYRAVAEAARTTGCKVHIVLAGQIDNPSVLQKFQQGAASIAPGVKLTMVKAMSNDNWLRVWRAADVFTSLSDNVQETLGLTILEAQACGIPVVASDWNGCRESITSGVTGFLVKTYMVRGATADGTSRHLTGETNYGEFLGATNQTVTVDAREATNAFTALFGDKGLRARMGAAGRARILELYTWPLIIAQYEAIWREQDTLRREHVAVSEAPTVHTPVSFPDVEHSFSCYPTSFLSGESRLIAAEDASVQLDVVLALPITNYLPQLRIVERAALLRVIEAAQHPSALHALSLILESPESTRERQLATLAWMLKYDLLRCVPDVASTARPEPALAPNGFTHSG